MKTRGESAERLKAAIDALPKVVYDPAHSAGLKAYIYGLKLDALKKAVPSK